MNSRKGLAPIIAAIILIVAAIIIGTVAVTWMSSWVGQRSAATSAYDCTLTTSYSVPSLTYNQANPGAGSALVGRITNTGTATVGNFTAELEFNNGTLARQVASAPAATTNLTAGQSATLNITMGDNTSIVTSVRIFPNTCKNYAITVRTIY